MQRPDEAARISPVTRLLVAALLVGGMTAAVVAFFGTPGTTSLNRAERAEQGRAEVFALRALAAAGLYDPRGDYYALTNVAMPARSGWRVAFRRYRCGRFGNVETCRPVTGEIGESLADAWLTVTLHEGIWRVGEIEGDFDASAKDDLTAFSRPDVRGAPHWEYPSVVIDKTDVDGETAGYSAALLWVGPIPFEGPGSACEARGYLEDRLVFVSEHRWYMNAPNPSHDRAGAFVGGSFDGVAEVDRAEVVCEQFDGAGWQVANEPSIVTVPGDNDVVIEADLVWEGEPLVMGQSWCTVHIYDEDGALLNTRTTASHPIWRDSELDDPPIRTTETVNFRVDPGDHVDSATVGCVPN